MITCPDDGGKLVVVGIEAEDRTGQIIDGKFTIEALLGAGGMGAVYRAFQHSMERQVAVKLLHRSFSSDSTIVRRFLGEAKAASRLNHPHIITLFDFGQTRNGELYLLMELLEGRPLSALLSETGAMPPKRMVQIITQVCDALEHAHKHDLVHRDLKPDNIFVIEGARRKGDFVKVLDFGIAKFKTVEGSSTITRTGVVCGTPAYMSPEQALGESVDCRSDVYAIGILMYEMLTGQLPFEAESPLKLLMDQVGKRPRAIHRLRNDLPEELAHIVMRALEKSPDDRPRTAAALADLLNAAWDRYEQRKTTAKVPAENVRALVAETRDAPVDNSAQTVFITGADRAPVDLSTRSAPTVEHRKVRNRAMGMGLAAAAVLAIAIGGWFVYQQMTSGAANTGAVATTSKPLPPAEKPVVAVAPAPPAAAVETGAPTPPVVSVVAPATRPAEAEAPRIPAPSEVIATPVVEAPAVPTTVDVVSKPAGAVLYVDGKKVGKTPMAIPRAAPGTVQALVARKPGYKDAKKVIPSDHRGAVKLTLRRRSTAPRGAGVID